MSGPRRHGARTARAVAACTLALLVLSGALLRGGVASARPGDRRGHGDRAAGTELVGAACWARSARPLNRTRATGWPAVLRPQRHPGTDGRPTPHRRPRQRRSRPRPTPGPPARAHCDAIDADAVRHELVASPPADSRRRPAPSGSRRPRLRPVARAEPARHGEPAPLPARPSIEPVNAIGRAPVGVPELGLATSLAGPDDRDGARRRADRVSRRLPRGARPRCDRLVGTSG